MRLYRVSVEIFEESSNGAYAAVTHLFHGPTETDAREQHEAHRQADAFLRACEDTGQFQGRLRCRAVVREGWVELPEPNISERRTPPHA
jgi:hypothetical protein